MTSEKRPLSSVNCCNICVNVNESDLRSLFWSMSALTGTYIPCGYQCRVPGSHTRSLSLFWVQNISLKNNVRLVLISLFHWMDVWLFWNWGLKQCSRSFLFILGQNYFIGSILTQTLKVGVTGQGATTWIGSVCQAKSSRRQPNAITKRNHPQQPLPFLNGCKANRSQMFR